MVLGLAGQAEALARGDVSSSELVEESLEVIGRKESLGAFRVVRAEAAAQEALEADKRLADGDRLPLLGVPVAIKDDTDLAGRPRRSRWPGTTCRRSGTRRSCGGCGRPGPSSSGRPRPVSWDCGRSVSRRSSGAPGTRGIPVHAGWVVGGFGGGLWREWSRGGRVRWGRVDSHSGGLDRAGGHQTAAGTGLRVSADRSVQRDHGVGATARERRGRRFDARCHQRKPSRRCVSDRFAGDVVRRGRQAGAEAVADRRFVQDGLRSQREARSRDPEGR